MPVPVRVIKEAAKPLAQRVLEFLEEHRQLAYSVDEIYSHLEGIDGDQLALVLRLLEEGQQNARLAEYQAALDQLVRQSDRTRVQSVPYDGRAYYYCEPEPW
jgi:hypothetical protein